MTAYDLGPLDHLAPEDADLYRALYLERNAVSRGELRTVRANAFRESPWALLEAWENFEDDSSPGFSTPVDD